MPDRFRQEVLNVLLAQLLRERGVVAAPETIIAYGPEKRRRMPDVIVSFRGLRTIIEGEVDDQSRARDRALNSARRRVEEGIAHIGVAVVYPADLLREADFGQLKSRLADAQLRVAIVTESGSTDFTKVEAGKLENTLRRAFDEIVQEDVVKQAVSVLDAGIDYFADVIVPKRGIVGRLAKNLGIRELPEASKKSEK